MQLNFSVEHKPGAIRLDNFPLLVYLPFEAGEGVRTVDNWTKVDDIVEARLADPHLSDADLATRFKTTTEHVKQAVIYSASPKS